MLYIKVTTLVRMKQVILYFLNRRITLHLTINTHFEKQTQMKVLTPQLKLCFEQIVPTEFITKELKSYDLRAQAITMIELMNFKSIPI